jgi:hypothetical protein
MENRDRMTAPGPQVRAGTGLPAAPGPYIDWAAILGGAFLAVALATLAAGFGAALGLTTISAERGEESSGLLGVIISTLWIVLSMIGAYAVGGYVAGRMRRRLEDVAADEVRVRDGVNGLIVWALGTVLSAMVLGSAVSSAVSTVGSVAATGAEVAGSVAGSVAGGAMSAASAVIPDEVTEDPMAFVTGSLLRPTTVQPGVESSEATTADAASILGNIVTTGEISDSDRAYLVQLTAARTGLPPAEVEARVEQAIAAAQTARQEAARAAEAAEQAVRDAAETARISAILTAFLLTATALVAAVTSYVCAVRGGRDRDEGRIYGGLAYR